MSTPIHRVHRALPASLLWLALGCPDEPGETAGDASTGGEDTTAGPTTAPTSTMPTTDPDTTVGSSDEGSTTVAEPEEIEVSIDGTMVQSGDVYVLSTPVDVGATGAALAVEIDNVGGAELTVGSVTLDTGDVSHFALDDTGLAATVPPAGSTSVTLAFAPANGGRKIAQLVIDSSDADEAPFTVTIEARSTPNTYRDVQQPTSPSARFNVGLTGLGDDRAVLFGGRESTGTRVNDAWVFEGELGDWTQLSPAQSPSARDTPALAYLGEDQVLMFGGTETSGPSPMVTPRDDTWVLDLGTGEWTELMPPESPPARFQHSMVGIGDGMAILYGGRVDFAMELEDTWLFDQTSGTWTDLSPASVPGPRSAFAMAYDGTDTILLTGGTVDSSDLVDETWLFSVTGNDWTMVAPAGSGDRFNHAIAWLEDGPFVTFSGKADCCSDPVAGTWAYDPDGDAWQDLTPALEPTPRYSYRMAHLGRDKIILFGGLTINGGPGSAVAETWEYVGP